ncbi:glycosyltransferase [Agriterribacter sp.]|uniref:glycosyltransferase n=1 Tax=Agriterribacter sp. TaxID=2821509 RepID=UPI002C742557|nr:glycosyltransferase [Agriterribacter sp.]HTN08997.1 glycosyltransferase [Agriterribacter sp.]
MELVVISDNYPSKEIPNKGAFVYNLVQELGNYHNITVIAPFKVHELFNSTAKDGYGKERCKVYRPIYLSFSNKKILGINTHIWSRYFKAKAVNKCLNNLPVKPDMVYAHFLSNAIPGLSYINKHLVPLVIASGESSYSESTKALKKDLHGLKDCTHHFICVSEGNKKGLVELGFSEHKMSIIPNAVDYSLFKPMDKNTCKEKLGIPKKKFVVGFVGHFIHRKGPNRIIEAITQLADKDIQLVCVGGKENLITNDFTKTIPPVPNYQLPELYNAFDIFVLPTLNEGHCNAIEEAKACCIPVVSSLGTTAELQIDNTTGILINPMEIGEIAAAIHTLKSNDSIRSSMEQNLRLKRGEQSLKNRAQKISSLLENIVKDNQKKK